MKKRTLLSFFIFSLLFVNLTNAAEIDLNLSKWKKIQYSKIEPNVLTQLDKSFQVSVNKSSSALVYKFDNPIKVEKFSLSAKLTGGPNYEDKTPGTEGADDFPLRLCLITKGTDKLNFLQRTIAASWLVDLDQTFSTAYGLDKLNCYLFYTEKPAFEEREHPLSSYFLEKANAAFQNGLLDTKTLVKLDKDVIGLWLSSDGDDTKSIYSVIVNKIEINK